MTNLRSFLIEYRKNLQSANVLITFTENLIDTETNIKIKTDTIFLKTSKEQYKIDIPNMQVNIHSVHNLIIKNNSISFRFNSQSFGEEILKIGGGLENENSSNNNQQQKINIKENEDYSLNCENCKSNLSVEEKSLVKFERILELPSSGDISEW